MESGPASRKAARKCWLRIVFILMACLAALLASVAFGRPLAPSASRTNRPDSNTETQLAVRVYNYAQIDPPSLVLSEKVAAAIFERVGVRMVWIDCPLSAAQSQAYGGCLTDMRPADLVLRILPRYMAEKLRIEAEPLGYAQPCSDRDPACEVTVFYYRVDELAAMGYRADRILGYVIAHEMAHVLIGPGHSAEGIMRAIWSSNDLQRMSWGLRVDFTSEESELLRSAIMRRAKAQ